MTPVRFLSAAACAALAACGAPAMRPVAAPPLVSQFVVTQAEIVLPAHGPALTGAERARIAALPAPRPDGLRPEAAVSGPPAAAARIDEAAGLLRAAGVSTTTRIDPDTALLRVTAPRYAPAAPVCPDFAYARLAHPVDALTGNPMPAHDTPLGCATIAALDAMVARPRDLTDPPAGPAASDSALALRATARRRTEGLQPLPSRAASSF